MDLFFNRDLVEKTTKSKTKIGLKINGGTMKVPHQGTVNGYHNIVWFSENYVSNIISLINLHLKYLVIYRSVEIMFIIQI